MLDQSISQAKQQMQQVLAALTDQLKNVHVGRASASMVEDLPVEQYGTMMALKQVGSITIPEANQIVISPWDKGALGPIESAVRKSDLGFNPINDGQVVRIVLPQLNEERRRELTKVVSRMAEEARIALRNARHESLDRIQKAQKETQITEDDLKRGRDELDKLIAAMNKEVDQIAAAKEAEMLAL